MRPLARGAIVAVALLAAVAPARAWSATTRIRMAREAIQLMPTSLRTLLERHESDLLRGMLEPMTEEDAPSHRPPSDGGTLPGELARRSEAVVDAVDSQRTFSEVARRFGELAHFASDAGFPPNAGGVEDDARYRHFAGLVESRLDRIRFVFYGHGHPDLERGDREAYVLAVVERARRDDEALARAYRAAGADPHPSAFDDRSVPFAIASLSYSRAVTDIVRVWLDAWGRAHGDMEGTPYPDR